MASKDNGYMFMKEKIVPQTKKKLKKFFLTLLGTIFFAVVFGLVARCAFLYSAPWLETLFGDIQDTTKQPVVLSTDDGPEAGNEHTDGSHTKNTTGKYPQNGTTAATEPTESTEPENPPTTTEGSDPSQEVVPTEVPPEPTPTPTPIIVEQRIDAELSDLIAICSDIRVLAAQVNSSILSITAVTNGVDWFNDPYEARKTTMGLVFADNGTDLLLLTSLDRITGADVLEVAVGRNEVVQGELLDYDKDVNLAVVAVPMEKISATTLETIQKAQFGSSYALSPGTPILAVGSPNGHVGSIELGIVTSKDSSAYIVDSRIDLFNTNITNHESSDGFIVNMQGKVVGIITRTLKEGVNEELSTAIGISRIMPLIQKLANKEDRSYLGIHGEEIPKTVLDELGITQGIYVNKVELKSPALRAGVKAGDIIVKIGDTSVNNMIGFYNTLSGHAPGKTVKVTVYRRSQGVYKEVVLDVTVGKK